MAKNIVIPKSQYAIAMPAEPMISCSVTFVLRMLAAIDFDNEAMLATNEIHDVRSGRSLPDKLAASECARSQAIPKSIFSVCGL